MTVTIYTRTTCAPCQTLKYWLNQKKVAFSEKDVDADPSLEQEIFKKSGYLMVPMIEVGDKVISGLNLPLISKALML